MKKFALSLVICAGIISLTGISQACCIYNNSRYPLKVEWNIFNVWGISPSNKQCTNGTGGKVKIRLMDGLRQVEISDMKEMEIDDHGWLSVYQKENNRWKVVNKHSDGSVKGTTYLTPYE